LLPPSTNNYDNYKQQQRSLEKREERERRERERDERERERETRERDFSRTLRVVNF